MIGVHFPNHVALASRRLRGDHDFHPMFSELLGNFVGGLTYRDFRVFENNQPQRIAYFTVDPYPLSIAFVIDQLGVARSAAPNALYRSASTRSGEAISTP